MLFYAVYFCQTAIQSGGQNNTAGEGQSGSSPYKAFVATDRNMNAIWAIHSRDTDWFFMAYKGRYVIDWPLYYTCIQGNCLCIEEKNAQYTSMMFQ